MSAERRQHNRIDVHWRARLLKKGEGVVGAIINNISIGGVFVTTRLQLSLHDMILVEFEISDESPPTKIVCECELMRRVLNTSDDARDYGLRFHRIKDDDLGYLLGYIARHWSVVDSVQ